jgi:hypothetical protein
MDKNNNIAIQENRQSFVKIATIFFKSPLFSKIANILFFNRQKLLSKHTLLAWW